ncbi:ExeA family protein [Variovorax sp. UMC13]|uniref:ExeA family protein n=1 Tax=Variovorax sp. UMC13 TaxID=1862326 RepID=UPI001600FEBD|nr:AAA family ATPase [Variovorax sp. UMC13]MBB1601557.1 hypothetical protein [Variovorax sp. UMC13]
MLNLKAALISVKRKQSDLARHLKVSGATVNLIINLDRWPKGLGGKELLQERIAKFLRANGADEATVAAAFNEAPDTSRANAMCPMAGCPAHSGPQAHSKTEDENMLLRKHTINRAARAHFKIPRDPFTGEMETEADVFLSDDIRYVRASMRQTAKHGGMLAVIAESGGGKSTLRHDLNEWINTSGEPITVIEPYVLGMASSERKGRPLKAEDITGAVIRAVSPGTSLRAATSQRSGQMHDILKASAQIGRKHVVIIEEAHDLATPTLKHLKRFYELQDGFKKLLAIILIGQTELELKLSERNPEVREVVQRCEMVKLPPLDNHVEAYLRHKFTRVDVDLDAVMAPDAIEEIRNRLQQAVTENTRGSRVVRSQSLCHPLAINNLVSAAMNEAVTIGAAKVTAGLISAVARAE